jgi:antitoxin FitA
LVEHFHGKEGVTSSSLVPGFQGPILGLRGSPVLLVSARGAIIAITMAQLLVRDIESDVVRELKIRAAQHGRSAEEEHRQILREALRSGGSAKPLKEFLLDMPDIGEDRDFERPEDRGRPVEL